MARTNVPLSIFVGNGNLDDPAGTAGDAVNGHVVTGAPLDEIILRIHNGGGAGITATVRAGVYPPALSNGQGDLAVTVAAGATEWIGPFTGARFAQKDGSLNLDLSAAASVTVTAFQHDHKSA